MSHTAKLTLKLESTSGYTQDAEYTNVTPEQWGEVVRVLEGLPMPNARERFEEKAYAHRFVCSIQDTGKGPFPLQSVDCPTKAEFCSRREEGGAYNDPTLQMMWWGWTKRGET